MSTNQKKTVAVDFDGTLAQYEHGFEHPPVEPPTPGAAAALQLLAASNYDVVVFSVRATRPDGVAAIHHWLVKYGLDKYVSGITAVKPMAVAYIDDRGVPFDGNWSAALAQVGVLEAKEAKKGQTV